MPDTPDFGSIAALVGEPTRAAMLTVLMDGRSYSATELALEGEVSPSTASSHLSRMTDAQLLTIVKQGRHRYYRLATPEVATVVEGLMSLAARAGPRTVRTGPADTGLRHARVCYDHLAGEVAVQFLSRLRKLGYLEGGGSALSLTGAGAGWCAGLGLDIASLQHKRRPLCRTCLDWSERRYHLAGALGAALFDHMLAHRMARRDPDSRKVTLSPRGLRFLGRSGGRPEHGLNSTP
jgi:DNA-binding transcriptional ArsR family regulator